MSKSFALRLIVVESRLRIVKKRVIDNSEDRAESTIDLERREKEKTKIVSRKNKRERVANREIVKETKTKSIVFTRFCCC